MVRRVHVPVERGCMPVDANWVSAWDSGSLLGQASPLDERRCSDQGGGDDWPPGRVSMACRLALTCV